MKTSSNRGLVSHLSGLLLATLIAACGGGGAGGGAGTQPAPSATAQLDVAVIDSLGRAVAGASLNSAGDTATTNSEGRASLSVATGSEQLISVHKDGFAEQVKVITLAAGSTGARLQAMLIARQAPLTIAAVEAGGSVTGTDGVKVTLPAAALVTSNGQAVSGAVQLNLTPVDVTQLDVGAFPGLFEGTRTGGARTDIASFGTAELVPMQGGQKLQLAAGKTAEIELPLYVTRHPDGADVQVGDKIALWSLNAATGLWTQEGEGTVVTSASVPTGLALRATIAHFSWWNVDVSTSRAFVDLIVNVPGTAVVPPGTNAAVEGRIVAGAGPTWTATATVPLATPTRLFVPAGSTTRLSAQVDLAEQACTGSVDVNPPPDAIVNATINTTCVDLSLPRIVRPAGLSATNSTRDVSVQVLIDGPRADLLEVFADDTLIAQFNAAIQVQNFFTAFFDSSAFAEGTYALRARATRQGVSRDSATVEIVVDRTAPLLDSLTPDPGSEVSQATVFTLDFSEPVNSLPFRLTDAVSLAVTPLNASAPVQVPITATLSTDGRQLSVQAQGALPLGVISLTWGGLKDAARNPIAGSVSATFPIDRSSPLLAQPQQFVNFGPPIAITGSGQLIAAWAESDNNLRVGAHDGTAFVLFGAAGDNPIGSAGVRYDLALDAADLPHVAYTRGSGANEIIVVRRFNGASWEDLGPAFSGVQNNPAQQPRLLIDPSGRPVLALTRNGFVEVFRFDAASGTWASLGVPAAALSSTIADLRFDLALLPGGEPVVALVQAIDVFNNSHLKAARHNGSAWVALGGVLASQGAGGQIGQPRIAGGSEGPWIHYVKSGGELRLLRFNGSDWDVHDVPRPANATTLQNPNALGLSNDAPVVVWNDFSLGVFVTRFAGGSFDEAFPAIGRPSQLSIAIRNTTAGTTAFIGAQPFSGLLIVERLLLP
jgi:Bacterial Ig-like domain